MNLFVSYPTFFRVLRLGIFLVQSCSLGTEVGNGLKPRRNEGGSSEAPDNKGSSAPETKSPVSAQGAPVDSGKGNRSPSQDEVDSKNGPLVSATSSAVFNSEAIILNILTTHCASPWAENLQAPISLEDSAPRTSAPIKLSATRDAASQYWRVASPRTSFWVQGAPEVSAYTVKVLDEHMIVLAQESTCSAVNLVVSGDKNTRMIKHSVDISLPSGQFKLVWNTAELNSLKILKSVEITTPDNATVTLQNTNTIP